VGSPAAHRSWHHRYTGGAQLNADPLDPRPPESDLIKLYDNPFSPFARKVRMVLQFKEVAFQAIDALAVHERERLLVVNPSAEVPVLVDDEVTVLNSADIVAYLEDRFPTPTLFPPSPELRAKMRSWQRIADTVLDAIIHDTSLWAWPTHRRTDQPPAGLLEEGRRDLETVLGQLEESLDGTGFLCGALSIADLALFPHISSLKFLGVSLDPFQRALRWSREMRTLPVVRADLAYVKRSVLEKFSVGASPYEAEKVVWRGDRIEWLIAHGFQDWFQSELVSGRAVVPRRI
jgi:glutathione S-transferase